MRQGSNLPSFEGSVVLSPDAVLDCVSTQRLWIDLMEDWFGTVTTLPPPSVSPVVTTDRARATLSTVEALGQWHRVFSVGHEVCRELVPVERNLTIKLLLKNVVCLHHGFERGLVQFKVVCWVFPLVQTDE